MTLTVLTARVEARTAERRELAQALIAWAKAARAETGARGCSIYEDLETPAVFYLISQWESRQTFQAHVGGPRFGSILGALDLLALPPQVAITEIAEATEKDSLLALRRLRDRRRTPRDTGPDDPSDRGTQ